MRDLTRERKTRSKGYFVLSGLQGEPLERAVEYLETVYPEASEVGALAGSFAALAWGEPDGDDALDSEKQTLPCAPPDGYVSAKDSGIVVLSDAEAARVRHVLREQEPPDSLEKLWNLINTEDAAQ